MLSNRASTMRLSQPLLQVNISEGSAVELAFVLILIVSGTATASMQAAAAAHAHLRSLLRGVAVGVGWRFCHVACRMALSSSLSDSGHLSPPTAWR